MSSCGCVQNPRTGQTRRCYEHEQQYQHYLATRPPMSRYVLPAVICSLLLGLLIPVGLGLAIAALVDIRRHGLRGAGWAWTIVGVNGAVLLWVIGALVVHST